MNHKCSISLIPEYRSVKPLPIRGGYLNCYVIGGVMCLFSGPIAGPIRVSVNTSKTLCSILVLCVYGFTGFSLGASEVYRLCCNGL